MDKIHIKIIALGHAAELIKKRRIIKWKSDVFKIDPVIDEYSLSFEPDLYSWGYSDAKLWKHLKEKVSEKYDLTFCLIDRPIEDNYFSRIINGNTVIVSFYEAKDMLFSEQVPLENYLMVTIYSTVLLYMTKGAGSMLTEQDERDISHSECRGCLYDFCGLKHDLIASCTKASLCSECEAYLLRHNVPMNTITMARREIRRIRRDFYSIISRALKRHPVWSLTVYAVSTILLGIVASAIYSLILNSIVH